MGNHWLDKATANEWLILAKVMHALNMSGRQLAELDSKLLKCLVDYVRESSCVPETHYVEENDR